MPAESMDVRARRFSRRSAEYLPRVLLASWLAASSLTAQTERTGEPASEAAVTGLIAAAKGGDTAQARLAALKELVRIGPGHRAVVPALAALLSDRDAGVRRQASEALKNLGPAAAPALDELIAALASRVIGVSSNAQQALVSIGPRAIPTLIASLEKLSERARSKAIWVLGYMGDDATPALIDAMKNDQVDIRVVAIRAIIEMGEKGQRAVPALVRALGDAEEDVRESAANALSRVGSKARAAVPALVVALGDSVWSVRREAANALARVDPEPREAMPALIKAMRGDTQPEVRAAAATAIVGVAHTTPDRRRAVLDLIVALKDKDSKVLKAACSALGALGSDARDAVGPLVNVLLKDPDRHARSWAADALGEIGPAARAAVPSLIAALDEPDPWLRRIAAEALGKTGSATEDVISALIITLRDPAEIARQGAVSAMVDLAERSARAGDYTAIGPLKRACSALESDDAGTEAIEALEHFEPALDSLESSKRADWRTWTAGLFEQHPATVALIALIGLYPAWLLVLRFAILKRWPLRVLRWSRALAGKFEGGLPAMLGNHKVSLRSLALAGLEYHPLVLDAWVARHSAAARTHFIRSETVQARSTYVPIPLLVNEKPISALDASSVRLIQDKDRWSIGIFGEEGLGKTALACQIALRGLAERPADRLCPDVQMLPVLIEPQTGDDTCTDVAAFNAAVKGKLDELIAPEEPIPGELFERLLRTRRILVMLDGISEMACSSDASGGGRPLPMPPDIPAAALVITARARIEGPTILIEPRRLDRDHLLPFVSAYLSRADLADLPDATIYQVCARLAEMAGNDRGIRPILARALVEEVAAAVRAGRSPLDLTASVS